MQGIGNDYIYVNCFENTVKDPKHAAIRLSDRHFGIGSDGLILLCPSKTADIAMKMYNADGSEGKMCGNGIRCVGKLAYETGLVRKEEMSVETASGIKFLKLSVHDGKVENVRVDMGAPVLEATKIPVLSKEKQLVNMPVEVGGQNYRITCVSMGNPHAVVFTKFIDALELQSIGPQFECNKMFPERVNAEFAEIIDHNSIKMRVWERGSGETMACGTGACAVAVAACLNGLVARGKDITLNLTGGQLAIRWDESGTVFMTGPAELIFTGEVEL